MFTTCPSTELVKSLCRNDALLAIQVPLGAALRAFDSLSNLPECMTWVSLVFSLIGLVDARAVDEGFESLFIDPFVDVEVANHAFQVASGLSQLVVAWCRLLWLLVQQCLNLLRPGEFLGQLCFLVWRVDHLREHLLRAWLGQPGFQDVSGKALVHPQATVAALVPASLVLLPVVVLCIPGLSTPVDEVFFVLLRLLALVLRSLLVHIVLAVSKDLAEALDGMFIDQFVILV